MVEKQLNLKPGNWLVADCGKLPSETNCQVVLLAPESQKEDLIAAGVAHAVNKHGHADSEELQRGIGEMLVTLEVR